MREKLQELEREEKKTEDDLKSLQTVGQMIGEVLKQLTEDKCQKYFFFFFFFFYVFCLFFALFFLFQRSH